MNVDTFKNKFSETIKFNHKLANYTWFGVGGNAEIFFVPETEMAIKDLLNEKPKELKLFTIGAGSNILIRDKGLKGITLITKKLNKITIDKEGVITAGAGAMDADVARFARNNQRAGLEFLLGIPGTIGGGIRMNSGAFGSEFKNILIDVKAINHSGEFKIFSNEELGMKYRKIKIGKEWVFCSARFKSSIGETKSIESKMKKIIQARKSSQPTGVKTGGSTFKNPIGKKAWMLIDQAGCRGHTIGDAKISEKHCNFIINTKKSTAKQIEYLGEFVKKKVKENSGINLSWEIQKVGIK